MIKTEDKTLSFNLLLCKVIGHNYPEYDQAKRHGCACSRCGDAPLTFVQTTPEKELEDAKPSPPPAYTRSAQSFTGGAR